MFQAYSWHHVLFIAQAGEWTLLLALIALAGGSAGGAALAAMSQSTSRYVRGGGRGFVYAIQGTPLLVLLFLTFYGIAFLGWQIPALASAAIGFTLYASAFLGEIWRGALASIARGQWESAASLGLSRARTLRLIIMPQAVRVAIPPTVNFFIQLIKNTALASLLGFTEMMRASTLVANATFKPLQVYLTVGAMYYVICASLAYVSRRLEARSQRRPLTRQAAAQ
jgi:polar amino acid transport system permease protein